MGGLGEKVSGRLAFIHNEDDGLIENDFSPSSPAVRRTDDYSVRGKLLIEASEEASVLLKVQYSEEDASPGGYSFGLPSFNDGDFFGYSDADGNPFTGSMDFDPFQTSEVTELGMTINWDLGGATLTSVTNYQDIDHTYGEDADVSPNSLFNYTQDVQIEQISQEVRVNWEGDNHRSVMGVFYLDIEGDFLATQSGDFYFGDAFLSAMAAQDTKTYAVFGQTEVDLSETVALTVGLRYNKDEKDMDLAAPDFGFSGFVGSEDDDDFSGKVQLDYKPNDDWLLYAGVSRGIKSGGFNFPLTPLDGVPVEFDGETLTSFEAGFKATLSETTRLNASIYFYDYEDYQAYNIDGAFNTLLFNADAENSGAEIELIMNPAEGLDILLGASYIDSEVTDLPTEFNTLDPITFEPAQNYPTGEETPPLVPELTLNGLVRYAWDAFGGSMSVQVNFNWRDDHKFNLASSETTFEESYAVVNAKIGFNTEDGAWSGSIFVKNLADEEYRSFGIDGTLFFGSLENIQGAERWFGGNIKYQF